MFLLLYIITLSFEFLIGKMKAWKNTATLDSLNLEEIESCAPAEAELAILGSKPIDLEQFPKLKGLFKCGIGRDNVPERLCAEKNIEVCFPSESTQNYIYEETSSFGVYLILRMLYADIGSIDPWVKASRTYLGDRTVLLIGVGKIGGRVKRKLEALVNVTVYDTEFSDPNDLKALIGGADVVSLHVPLSDSTMNLINQEKLGWMKDGSALVNTARGPVVDERALLNEIESGRLRAAFDVFWAEPYNGELSHRPEGFFMTPHVASTCDSFLNGLGEDLKMFVERIS